MHDGTVQDLEPARARGLADHDLGDVVGLREGDHVIGNAPPAWDRHGLGAEPLAEPERVGDAVALLFGEMKAAPAFHVQDGPGGVQAIRKPLGIAHQPGAAWVLADADQDPLARGPGPRYGMGLHVREQLLIDALGGAPQRQFAQGGEIAGREIVVERALGLLWHVDLALFQPLHQVVRGQVDHLDVVRPIEDRVRNRLAHPDACDLGHDVVEALDVLDVHRRVDVDAGVQQFFDIEVALGMAAPGGVGVGKLIDQHELGLARQHGIEIHLLKPRALVGDAAARDDLEPIEERLGFRSPVRLGHADHDVDAVLPLGLGGFQHRVGLAHAGSGPEEDLEPAPAAFLPARCLEQRLRRGSLAGPALSHRLNLTSGRRAVQGQVQREHVDARLAQEPELPVLHVLGHELAQRILRKAARLSDAGHLEQGGLWRDVRDRDRCPRWSRGRSERPRTDYLSFRASKSP